MPTHLWKTYFYCYSCIFCPALYLDNFSRQGLFEKDHSKLIIIVANKSLFTSQNIARRKLQWYVVAHLHCNDLRREESRAKKNKCSFTVPFCMSQWWWWFSDFLFLPLDDSTCPNVCDQLFFCSFSFFFCLSGWFSSLFSSLNFLSSLFVDTTKTEPKI